MNHPVQTGAAAGAPTHEIDHDDAGASVAAAGIRKERDARQDVWICALLALVALAVRAIGLNGGLWLDEINGILAWMRPDLTEILTVYKGDGQHPMYALLGHLSIVLFGESAWSVRLPAALFGAACVPALYLLGRAAGSRREALFAALLLAVSYHHVWFSQNARGYTMLTFFVLLATYFLLRALEGDGRRWYIAYGIAIALGAYTHITVVFPAFAHFLIALWASWRADRRGPVIGFAIAAGLTLLLYAPILKQVVWWFLFRPSNFEGVSTPAWALAEAIRILQRGVVGGATAALGLVAITLGGTVFLVGAVSYWRQSRVVFALFTLPYLTTFAGALLARGTMYPRFFFFLLPYAVLMVVRGLERSGAWLGGRLGPARSAAVRGQRIASALSIAGILVFALSLGANYRYGKQDFGGAIAYIDSHRSTDESVLLAGAVRGPVQEYYERTWPVVESSAAITSLAGSGGYWIMYTFPRYIEFEFPDLMRHIDAVCATREVFPGTVGDGDIIVCHVPAESRPS